MIRLSTWVSLRRAFREWCLAALSVLVLARVYSADPGDWCLFFLGWNILRCLDPWSVVAAKSLFGSSYDDIIKGRCIRKNAGILKSARGGRTKGEGHDSGKKKSHPDMLTDARWMPSEVFCHMCSFLHPKDVTTTACLNVASTRRESESDVWKRLWYRDYGDALLKWDVGREAFSKSLSADADKNLETSLARKLSDLGTEGASFKDFYFDFGETFVDYLRAGRNKSDRYLLGMHGHVFDFTEIVLFNMEPIEDILVKNAMRAFEDVPHSETAREMARQMCVVANRTRAGDTRRCGLVVLPPPFLTGLGDALRRSNTRVSRARMSDLRAEVTADALPSRTGGVRRPATLALVRERWRRRKNSQLEWLTRKPWALLWTRRRLWRNSTTWRVFWDPFLREWVAWDADPITALKL